MSHGSGGTGALAMALFNQSRGKSTGLPNGTRLLIGAY
jgi:hypothetical protein